MSTFRNTIKIAHTFALVALLVVSASFASPAVAQPTPTINYQGKLTNGSGVAVADGTYNMRFWLLQSTSQATTSAVWTESLTGTDKVQVTNGLFSVMLGSTSPLTSVDFNQTLFLGVEIGGTVVTPAWDGEMLPRKPLGTVPAAFESYKLGGVASSSFLRSDQADSASGLISFDGGLISSASSSLTSVTLGTATATDLVVTGALGIGTSSPGRELVVDGGVQITGGLYDNNNSGGTVGQILQSTNGGIEWVATTSLGIVTTADDLSDNSIEDLQDVAVMTEAYGDLLYWNGSAWADIATSSLGLGNNTFLGLSDTPSSYTSSAIPYVSGSALAFNSNFVFDGTNLGIGTNAPGAMLDIFGASNGLRLSYDGSNYSELSVNSSGLLSINSTGGNGSGYTVGSGLAEDTFMIFDGNTQDYYLGLDDTDDLFKIGLGSEVGTSTLIQLSSATTTFNTAIVASTTATSTFTNGIALSGGCFQTADGNCLGANGDTAVVVAASDSPATEKAFADYVADGTNDQEEINTALAAIPSTGGTVYLLNGTYSINNSISIAATGTRLIGQGDSTALVRTASSTTWTTISVSGVSSAYIAGLMIDGSAGTGGTQHGITLASTASSTVEFVTIKQLLDYGIYFSSATNSTLQAFSISDLSDNGIYIDGTSKGINILRGSVTNSLTAVYLEGTVTDVHIEGNTFLGNDSSLGSIYGAADRVVVRGNRIETYGLDQGIQLGWESDNWLIEGNYIDVAGGTYGLNLGGGDHNEVQVVDNTIYGASLRGIRLNIFNDGIISGNILRNNTVGIQGTVYDTQITNNYIQDSLNQGIRLDASQQVSITGNKLEGNGHGGSYSSIQIVGTLDDNLIANNIIKATSTDALISIGVGANRTVLVGNTYINPDTTVYVDDSASDTRYNEWDRTTITTDSARGYNLFSIVGSTTATSAAITQLGTGDIFTLNNASGRVLTVGNSGNVGIGSSSPSAKLSVAGNTWLDSNVISFASTSASSLVLQYFTEATSTIKDNSTFAFTIATSTLASPIFRIDTSGAYANTLVDGSFTVNNGALAYDASTNQTTIENLALGNMTFADDAGIVTWTDMGITGAATAGDPMSYTASLDGNALLTVYGEANGTGGLQNSAVGVGTTTPWARFSVVGDSTDATKPLLSVASSTGSSLFHITYDGKVGIATTSPAALFAVGGASYIGGNLTTTGGVTFTGLTGGLLTTNSAGVLSTTTVASSSLAAGNWANGYILQASTTATGGFDWVSTTTLGIDVTADDLTNNSIEDLQDVAAMTKNFGDLLYWNGSAWADIATSSLGLGNGSFTGLTDTQNSLTANRVIFTNSGGTALTDSADLVFDGTNFGIGTTSPTSRLAIEKLNYSAAGVAGLDQYYSFTNSTPGAVQYGTRMYLDATTTATTTLVGNIVRLADNTAFGNTIRGFEVQTNRGTNTLGENTALSGFARTFGVRGTTEGDAGEVAEPAGVFGETRGSTQGNALRGFSSSITSAALMKLLHSTSTFTGTGLLMDFAKDTGTFSGNFLDLRNDDVTYFSVDSTGGMYAAGNVGIGTTSPLAKLSVAGDTYIGGALTATGTVTFTGLTGGLLTANSAGVLSTTTVASSSLAAGNWANGYILQASTTATGGFDWVSTTTLGITASEDLTNNSIEELQDVAAMTKNFGDLLYWNGSAWADIATSSLGISGGAFTSSGGYTTLNTSTDHVGIGTSSPYALLSISNTASTPAGTSLFTIASTTGGTATSTLFQVNANGGIALGNATNTSGLGTIVSGQNNSFTSTNSLNKYSTTFGLGNIVSDNAVVWGSSIYGANNTLSNSAVIDATSLYGNANTFSGNSTYLYLSALYGYNNTFSDSVDLYNSSLFGQGNNFSNNSSLNYSSLFGNQNTLLGDSGLYNSSLYGDFNTATDTAQFNYSALYGSFNNASSSASISNSALYGDYNNYLGNLTTGNIIGSHNIIGTGDKDKLFIYGDNNTATGTINNTFVLGSGNTVNSISNVLAVGSNLSTLRSDFYTFDNVLNIDAATDKVGIGTTSPYAKLSVAGDAHIGGNLTATGTVTFTGLTGGLLTANSAGVLSTTTVASSSLAAGNWANGRILQASTTATSGFDWVSTTTLGIDVAADDLTNNSIEDLNDVAAITENYGDLFYWNGSAWADIATSSLGLGNGSFLGLSDTPSSYTSNAIPFVSGGNSLAFNSNFVFDGTNLGIGTNAPGAMLDIFGASNGLRLSYDGSNYSELSVDNAGVLSINSTGGTGSTLQLGSGLAEDLAFLYDGNTQDYYLGLDDTDDLFKIGLGSEVGTSTLIQISSATTTFNTALYATSTSASPALTIVQSGSGDILNLFDSATEVLTVLYGGYVGIGTSTPNAKFSLQNTGFSGAGVVGMDQYLQTANSVDAAVQFGNRFYLHASNTATTTLVGSMMRFEDNTTFGNTLRGLEIQANRGANTLGENTALSVFGRTFGMRAVTTGDAGGSFEPAAGFFETEGTTQGNAVRGFSDTITTASLMALFHSSSTFAGTGLEMSFGNSGGSFSSSTSKFLDFQNAGNSVFTVSAYGTTTIGDGTTNNMASLQIGFGGICVDNDGSCTATSTGWVVADGFATGNSDLAEMYFSSTELEAGEIVTMIGSLSVDRASADSTLPILGVVSTNPGLTIGSDDTSLTDGETAYPIALSGRVPVKLSTENGPIKAGDTLMLSSLPGVATKATGTGMTIGIALEDFDDTRYYSETYLNQFGDSMVDPVYEPIFSNFDPRINDGCYYGGGNAIGDEPCVPLTATTTDGIVEEANAIAEQQSVAEQLEALADENSLTKTLADGTEVKVGQLVMFVEKSYRWLDTTQVASLGVLMSTSSIEVVGENVNETIFDRLVALANRFVDGVLSVLTLKADRVETSELCVDGVCVDANTLRQLLDGAGQPAAAPEPAPTTTGGGGSEPAPAPAPEPEVTPEPTPAPVEEEPVPVAEEPAPEPVVEEGSEGGAEPVPTPAPVEEEPAPEPAPAPEPEPAV